MSQSDLFKSLVWDNLVKAAIAFLLSNIGIAATGFLGGIVTGFVTEVVMLICNQLYAGLSMFVDLQVIQIRNDIDRAKFEAASEKLAIVWSEYGANSKEYQEAHEVEKNAFYKLVSFRPNPIGV